MNDSKAQEPVVGGEDGKVTKPVTAQCGSGEEVAMQVTPKTDWQGEEIRRRDKRKAALHEAAHVFVGQALGLTIVEAQLQATSDGGIETKHWVGSVRGGDRLPKVLDGYPPMFVRFNEFRRRMYALAGFVAEQMPDPDPTIASLSADDAMDALGSAWDDLSETDRGPFPEGFGSVSEKEVEALLRLLEMGWELFLEIADKLEEKEFLGPDDLDKFRRFDAVLPAGPDLADFDSWSINQWNEEDTEA